MSVEAITKALASTVKPASKKFVLVALANCANDQFEAYPSAEYLSQATSLDRKTVQSALRSLRDDGYIQDTGHRMGKTGQVIVYRITFEVDAKTPENGVVKDAQKRNSTENGTVPVFPSKRPNFPSKEAQKRATEPSGNEREPSLRARAGRAREKVTLRKWFEVLGDEKAVPPDDPIFDYARRIGMPDGFLHLAWLKFQEQYLPTDKKYKDWRAHYRNAVKNNWFRLWYERDGEWHLTTAGRQMEIDREAMEKAA